MEDTLNLIKIAQAEDTFDLREHIAWTDVIKPRLMGRRDSYAKQLVNHLLGGSLPNNLTKEQLAGKIYGIDEILSLMESILRDGKRALDEIQSKGVNIQL
jgi:hypothetical protein